jgi:hypothetical protein
MAKGSIAKDVVAKKIAQAFGSDYVGEFDKKIYVWAEENGEKVQIAISMTCPKVPVGADTLDFKAEPGDSLNFEDMSAAPIKGGSATSAEISEQEKKNIAELMARLGL